MCTASVLTSALKPTKLLKRVYTHRKCRQEKTPAYYYWELKTKSVLVWALAVNRSPPKSKKPRSKGLSLRHEDWICNVIQSRNNHAEKLS